MTFQSTQSLLDDDAARQWLRRRGLHLDAPDNPAADITADPSATPQDPNSGGKLKPEGQDVPDTPSIAEPPPDESLHHESPSETQSRLQMAAGYLRSSRAEPTDDAPAPVLPTRRPLAHADAVPPPPEYQASRLREAASYLSGQRPPGPPPSPDPMAIDQTSAGDELTQARRVDAEQVRQHNIGEGLQQFLSGFGNQPRYRPQLAAPPSEVEFVQHDQAARRQQAADYLLRKREGEQDALKGRLDESMINKNNADADKARMPHAATGSETDYQRELVDLRRRDQQLREADQKRKLDEADAKARGRSAGAAATKAGSTIPFPGGEFRLPEGVSIDKQSMDKARDHASQIGGAVQQMDELSNAMEDFVKNPGVLDKSALNKKVRITAQSISQAIGSGAMNNEEARAYSDILGVNLTTPGALESFVDKLTGSGDAKAAADFTSGVRSVRGSIVANAQGRLKSYHYDFAPGATKSPATAPSGQGVTPSGKPFARKQYSESRNQTRYLDNEGNTLEVTDGRR